MPSSVDLLKFLLDKKYINRAVVSNTDIGTYTPATKELVTIPYAGTVAHESIHALQHEAPSRREKIDEMLSDYEAGSWDDVIGSSIVGSASNFATPAYWAKQPETFKPLTSTGTYYEE